MPARHPTLEKFVLLFMWHEAQRLAVRAFSQVISRLAIRGNTDKSKVAIDLYGHLSLTLISRAILTCSIMQ